MRDNQIDNLRATRLTVRSQKRRRLIVRPTLGKKSAMWHLKLACEVLSS